jgi:Domain of Unknown Function (DUF1259)
MRKMKIDRPIMQKGSVSPFFKGRTRRILLSLASFAVSALFVLVACSAPQNQSGQSNDQQQAAATDWKPVEQAIGKAGSVQPDGVYKIGLPRTDLHVKVGAVDVKATLALGSWVAFRKMAAETMVMGDLVLTEDEVGPVMAKLQDGAIEITALHNHVLNESPRVMYMHINGHGDSAKLAQAIHDALALSKTPLVAPAAGAEEQFPLDTKQLDQIMGRSGKVNGGVDQFAIPRAEKIFAGEEARGAEPIPSSMGLATSINFQPTGEGRAAITGDFVLLGGEVNPVIRALRDNGIAVTALHSHMLTDSPRLFFMHFWANDDALKLARGLRAALDKTNSAK